MITTYKWYTLILSATHITIDLNYLPKKVVDLP